MSIEEFENWIVEKLLEFTDWYSKMNKDDANSYPLTLESDNAGAWVEMFVSFLQQ